MPWTSKYTHNSRSQLVKAALAKHRYHSGSMLPIPDKPTDSHCKSSHWSIVLKRKDLPNMSWTASKFKPFKELSPHLAKLALSANWGNFD